MGQPRCFYRLACLLPKALCTIRYFTINETILT